ncbi:glycosyltransferase, partial [Clostridium botulinum]
MKKKIMHIVQSPGGVERYISMFLKNMDLSKYDNILVCSLDYEEQKYVNLVSAFEYVDMTRKINLKSDLYAVIKIRKLIKKYNPDVIYLHSSKAGAIGRIANLGFKNK